MNHGERPAMHSIVFVCAGNTCRSPMAAALARAWLDERAPMHASRFNITSAGLMASRGLPATEGAAEAAARHGCSLENHRSRMLTPDMMRGARVITMTRAQAQLARQLNPDALIQTLSSWAGLPADEDIRDPYHSSDVEYAACCAQIKRMIDMGFDRMLNNSVRGLND
jgi:protein-tyrosine-phosphatase